MKFTKNETLAMKGIAILMMYVHHFYLDPSRWEGYTVNFFPITAGSTVYIANFFKICVAIFVFITGYGMTMSVKKQNSLSDISTKDTLPYIEKRLFSLLSNFIFVFLLVQVLAFPTGRFFEMYGKSGSALLYFIIDMFGLAKLFKTPSFLGTWWYVSLAIVLIIIFPFLLKLYQEYRWTFLLGVVFLPRMIGLAFKIKLQLDNDLLHWIFAMVLGIYCAETDFFTRWKEFEDRVFQKIPAILLFCLHLIILCILVIFRQSEAGSGLLDVFDGIIPVYVIYFSLRYIVNIPGLHSILMFLGKHSMNMFLIHSFIRTIYFESFSYGFGNAWINVLVLVLVTVPLSMIIEFLKKITHFHQFAEKVRLKITA